MSIKTAKNVSGKWSKVEKCKTFPLFRMQTKRSVETHLGIRFARTDGKGVDATGDKFVQYRLEAAVEDLRLTIGSNNNRGTVTVSLDRVEARGYKWLDVKGVTGMLHKNLPAALKAIEASKSRLLKKFRS